MKIPIIIPVYNEEDNVVILYRRLKNTLEKIKNSLVKDYEIIFVDDGSTDNTYSNISKLKDEKLKIIKFKKNYGKTSALDAGFKHAKGNIIVTMDADLQNDPKDIPKLLKKLFEGYDCVCGWKKVRKDTFIKNISSKIGNHVRRLFLKDGIKDALSPLKVFKKMY